MLEIEIFITLQNGLITYTLWNWDIMTTYTIDDTYVRGYLDAVKRLSEEVKAYADYAFDSEEYNEEEVGAITQMEGSLQAAFLDIVNNLQNEYNDF
jgi:hypothetical protein